jgi:hypothetical protein
MGTEHFSYDISELREGRPPARRDYSWTVVSHGSKLGRFVVETHRERSVSDPSRLPTWQRAECAAFDSIMRQCAHLASEARA